MEMCSQLEHWKMDVLKILAKNWFSLGTIDNDIDKLKSLTKEDRIAFLLFGEEVG